MRLPEAVADARCRVVTHAATAGRMVQVVACPCVQHLPVAGLRQLLKELLEVLLEVLGATWTLTAFLLFITLMYPIIHSLSDLGEESTLELLCLP